MWNYNITGIKTNDLYIYGHIDQTIHTINISLMITRTSTEQYIWIYKKQID
jgi:hypothetical protein